MTAQLLTTSAVATWLGKAEKTLAGWRKVTGRETCQGKNTGILGARFDSIDPDRAQSCSIRLTFPALLEDLQNTRDINGGRG